DLPPLDEACLPSEPPPPREPLGGVTLGAELVGVRFADGVTDVGARVVEELAAVRPGLVGLASLGSTEFAGLTAERRIDALVLIEQHRAWLDGVQQQLLAAVEQADTSK